MEKIFQKTKIKKKEEKTFKKNTIFLVGIYFQWKNLKKEKNNKLKKQPKFFREIARADI